MGEQLNAPIASIRENPVALRAVNQQGEGFIGIRDSVKSNGILNPINVRRKKEGKDGKPDGREFEIIDGLHRYTAALVLGLKDIPVHVLEKTDEEALVAQVIGNIHRVETTASEYTKGLLRLLSHNPGLTEAELAAQLSVSPAFINQRLSLNKLSGEIMKLVDDGKIALSNAFPMTKLDQDKQLEWVEKAMTMGTAEFGPLISAAVKKQKDDKRAAKPEGPTVFEPVPHLRKLSQIKDEHLSPTILPALLKELKIKDPIKAAETAVAWVLNMDPLSQQEQRQRNEEREKRDADQKAKNEAIRTQKKAEEAQKNQAELQQKAAEAREAAKRRGVDLATTGEGIPAPEAAAATA